MSNFYLNASASCLGLFLMHHKSSRHGDKSGAYQLSIPTAAFKTLLNGCMECFHMISLNAEASLVNPCWVANAVVSACLCALTSSLKKRGWHIERIYAADFKYICPQRDGRAGWRVFRIFHGPGHRTKSDTDADVSAEKTECETQSWKCSQMWPFLSCFSVMRPI